MATRATIGVDLGGKKWEPCGTAEVWVADQRAMRRDWQEWGMPKGICSHAEHQVSDRANVDGSIAVDGVMDDEDDWEEMLKGGLQTALETQVIVFAVKGVSRTCTHQLVRSRRASFHQQSQRASYMGDNPELRMPESIWRNMRARKAFLLASMECWRAYRIICEEDISYQDARFTLQEGTTGFIMLEYPVREFLNVFAYRGCSMFQWEIVDTMRKCRDALLAAHPWMEPYVKISCEKIERCTFQGWESPEGQCDFPWAKDETRTFKPEFHEIKRRPGMPEKTS